MTGPASAARARVGNLLLCSLLLCGLAACGSGSSGSSGNTPTASAGNVGSSVSLVSPRVGTINRGPTSAATTPKTASSTPTGSTATGSSSTSVASNGTGKGATQPVTPPVKGTDGSATLDWTPPTQNSDGTSLTNLAGYTVYYGTSPSNLNQSVKLTNPGLTAYTVSNLAPGTWYFAIASYSSNGAESTPSGVVSTTI
jgi:hypothetical protein